MHYTMANRHLINHKGDRPFAQTVMSLNKTETERDLGPCLEAMLHCMWEVFSQSLGMGARKALVTGQYCLGSWESR